ncbi:putative integral membrane protein [Acanthocheilonema viteae]
MKLDIFCRVHRRDYILHPYDDFMHKITVSAINIILLLAAAADFVLLAGCSSVPEGIFRCCFSCCGGISAKFIGFMPLIPPNTEKV